LTPWFEKIVTLPEFVNLYGKFQLCNKIVKPIAPPKVVAKPAQKPAAAHKDEGDDDDKPKKKEANPLD